jgi:acyl-CoA reductase-like NAD-dependent aldehyde dehydrogenase
MSTSIAIAEIGEAPGSVAWTGDSTAQQLAGSMCTLRFRLIADADSLEALRYARRSMLREEWTRGTEDGEPSLEEAIFSAFEVVWTVPADERERCRAKLAELVERANRALAELAPR